MVLVCPGSMPIIISGQCGAASDPVTATAPAGAGHRAGEREIEKPASACRGEGSAESLECE